MPIFDQGYQHWDGKLAGHGWRWLAITRHGVQVGMKNRWVRLLLLGALIPALMLAGVISLWGLVENKTPWAMTFLRSMGFLRDLVDDPTSFRITAWTLCFHFFIVVEMFVIMVVVLLVGPSLVSQDLRYNALPLYFSRPVRRIDYFLGKLGVIGFFLGMVAVAPAVIAWVLGLLFSLSFSAMVDTFRLLMGMVLSGFIITLSAGLFILALSSLSRNSRYVAVFWAGMWFLTSTVSAILQAIHHESLQRQTWRVMDNQYWNKRNELQNLMNRHQPPFNNQFNDPRPKPVNPDKLTPQESWELENWKRRDEERKRDQKRIDQLQAELNVANAEIQKRQEDAEESLRDDWRPMVAYTTNLQRISFALIGSEGAWDKVDDLAGLSQQKRGNRGHDPFNNPPMRRMRLAKIMVPQYPWYWSALVLLALGGISIWILHKRVTSLDRLR